MKNALLFDCLSEFLFYSLICRFDISTHVAMNRSFNKQNLDRDLFEYHINHLTSPQKTQKFLNSKVVYRYSKTSKRCIKKKKII